MCVQTCFCSLFSHSGAADGSVSSFRVIHLTAGERKPTAEGQGSSLGPDSFT